MSISRQPLGRLTCGNFCKEVASLLLNIRYSQCMWVTPTARAKYNNKRCQICSHYNNSSITGAISLKLGMYDVGRHPPGNAFLCVTIWVLCTCASAGGASRSRERLGPLRSNLYAVRHRLVGCLAKVTMDPVCTCARAGCLFQISGTAGSIASKFGTPLVTC